ncbi:hypothetical protein CRE_05596 [Caenorhabditis remanei]|uniref:T20D4.11-like domain-containing protein n=1 Tax=Caenorhabditis remanei TaxID=31234 RepID=E3M062_CAERE|nr:hypothetical protein CRE_05596 [Caenorhabditis remanei]
MIKKVILLCLIGLAIAKINFIREFKPVCTRRHAKYVDYGCLLSIRNITKTARETRLTSTIAQEFKSTCKDIERCFFPLSCSPVKSEVETSRWVHIFCGHLIYLTTDFLTCGAKLQLAESQCYKTWNLQPDALKHEKDEIKRGDQIKKSCDNFFGAENCMEQEVTEFCGKEKWIQFRDHFIELNPIMNNCSLSENQIFQAIPTTTETPYLFDFKFENE